MKSGVLPRKKYSAGTTGVTREEDPASSGTAREGFKRFNVLLKNIRCMILPKTRAIAVLACMLLLIIPACFAASADSLPAVPLIGVGIPDILQEKSKLTYTSEDFEKEGDKASERGNYDDAVKYYDKAAEKVVFDQDRKSEGFRTLMQLANKKATVYRIWGGHRQEENAEILLSNSYLEQVRKETEKEKARDKGLACLIVTATFGSPMAGEVQLVRDFRDGSLVQSYTGSRFMPGFNAWYYSFSPQVSMYINGHPQIKPFMQAFVTPTLQIVLLAQACYSFLRFNKEIATIAAILVGSALYGLVYIFPPAMAAAWVARRRGWNGGGIRSMWPAAVAWIVLLLLMVAGTVFSLDLLTTIASGLVVVATIVLVVGSLTLGLSRYVGKKPARQCRNNGFVFSGRDHLTGTRIPSGALPPAPESPDCNGAASPLRHCGDISPSGTTEAEQCTRAFGGAGLAARRGQSSRENISYPE